MWSVQVRRCVYFVLGGRSRIGESLPVSSVKSSRKIVITLHPSLL